MRYKIYIACSSNTNQATEEYKNSCRTKRIVTLLTIHKQIAHIYQKLQVNSKAQIISMAHKNKWI